MRQSIVGRIKACSSLLSSAATVTVLGAVVLGGVVPRAAHAVAIDDPGVLSQSGPSRRGIESGARAGQPITELTAEAMYEFLLAEIALQRGQNNVATQAYLDLARRTKDPRVARRAAEVAMHARMPNAAVEAARIWFETDADSEDALRAYSSLLVATGKLDEAEPHLRNLIARKPDGVGEQLQQLGQFLGSNQDKAAVLRLVRRLAEPHAQVAGARLAVAQAAFAAEDDALALAEARAAGKLRPGWEQAALVEGAILQRRSVGESIEHYRAFLATYPKSRQVRMQLARSLVSEKNFDGARAQFQRLTTEYPNDPEVVYAVGLLSMQLEDWPLAETHLKHLLTLEFRDHDLVRMYLGQIAEERKDFAGALERYRSVKGVEHLLTAQIRQSNVIAKQGDLNAARSILQQAPVTNNQQRVQVILAETQLLRDANKTGEAFEVAERGLEKLPNHPDLLYDHAMLAEKLDRVELMEASLRKVIAIQPDHAHAHNALGYSLADRNLRLSEARELIEKALKLSPEDYFIIDSMGWVLYRQGDLQGALKHLQRAYKGRPDAEIAAHLGEVLWELGQRDEAQRVWQEGSVKSPDNETLQKTIKRFRDATAVK